MKKYQINYLFKDKFHLIEIAADNMQSALGEFKEHIEWNYDEIYAISLVTETKQK